MLSSGLYVVATPIGNLSDISGRALNVLSEADIIACEDTRVSKKLFSLLGLPLHKKFISYQNYSEQAKASDIADIVADGNAVALISDAGSPLISDPGYKLVRCCRERGLAVLIVPGPSAVISALQLSGLPTNRFLFAGFIPNKDKARRDMFNELANTDATLVFYETAVRLVKTLYVMADVFDSREIAVAREITKIYEECRNGSARELIEHFETEVPKGEIVIMVAPPVSRKNIECDVNAEVKARLVKMSLKSAVEEVTLLSGKNKKDVYRLALEIRDDKK